MSDVYKRTDIGTVPVNCVDFKDYIKLPQVVTADDSLITTLLSTATDWAERYTRREFRKNTYTLTFDKFPVSILLRRDPVASITSVTYKVDDVVTTVPAADYYLVKDVQDSRIVLNDEKEWPTDGDEINKGLLASIVATFVTEAYTCQESGNTAIQMITARLYSERGDCTTGDAARQSGATALLDQFRIVRI